MTGDSANQGWNTEFGFGIVGVRSNDRQPGEKYFELYQNAFFTIFVAA